LNFRYIRFISILLTEKNNADRVQKQVEIFQMAA
jgi:hypothetical protein